MVRVAPVKYEVCRSSEVEVCQSISSIYIAKMTERTRANLVSSSPWAGKSSAITPTHAMNGIRTGTSWTKRSKSFKFMLPRHLTKCGRRVRTCHMRRGMDGRGSVEMSTVRRSVLWKSLRGHVQAPVLQLAVASITQESIILNDAPLVVDDPKLALC